MAEENTDETTEETAAELPPDLYARITELSERGNEECDAERYEAALPWYEQALALVPPPEQAWEAATWLHTALGDCLYLLGRHQEAHDHLYRAVRCAGGLGNPFIHLRLGQVNFELGDERRASNELARAYMGGGREIFDGEDPKYLTFLRQFMIGI